MTRGADWKLLLCDREAGVGEAKVAPFPHAVCLVYYKAQTPASFKNEKDAVAVWRTGGGKSVLFAIPAMTVGTLAVVVLPLIALIDDLLRNLESRHIRTIALHGQMTHSEVDAAMRRLWLAPEAVKVVLVSAEKLVYNPQVVLVFKKLAAAGRRLRR